MLEKNNQKINSPEKWVKLFIALNVLLILFGIWRFCISLKIVGVKLATMPGSWEWLFYLFPAVVVFGLIRRKKWGLYLTLIEIILVVLTAILVSFHWTFVLFGLYQIRNDPSLLLFSIPLAVIPAIIGFLWFRYLYRRRSYFR